MKKFLSILFSIFIMFIGYTYNTCCFAMKSSAITSGIISDDFKILMESIRKDSGCYVESGSIVITGENAKNGFSILLKTVHGQFNFTLSFSSDTFVQLSFLSFKLAKDDMDSFEKFMMTTLNHIKKFVEEKYSLLYCRLGIGLSEGIYTDCNSIKLICEKYWTI